MNLYVRSETDGRLTCFLTFVRVNTREQVTGEQMRVIFVRNANNI